MIQVTCEECAADINIPDDVMVGEIIKCKECATEYEVASLEDGTVELKPAEVAEEDWGE